MTKTERVIAAITQMIESGALSAGDRLPSVRQAAAQFGVSKNTIVEAYGRLSAAQTIQPRPGAGYFVGTYVQSAPATAMSATAMSVTEASDTVSLLRAQLTQDFDLRPGDGRPPLAWMRDALPRRVDTSLLAGSDSDQTGYGNPGGHARLRDLIARRFAARGVRVAPSQIVTTFGANHALDLIIRRYLSAGQTVLVDDPGYYPLFAKLRLAGVRAIPVPRRANGPDPELLHTLAAQYQPKLFFTQSTAHNPTGTSYDLQTAHDALRIADRFGIRIVDDDPFVDLQGQGVTGTPLWELDGFRSVIFVGTYSKLLSASFRVGYVISDQSSADALKEIKMITTVNSSRLSEMLIAQMVQSRRYQQHLKQLSTRLEQARADCLSRVRDLGLRPFSEDPTGFYTMLRLPPQTDITRLQEHAKRQRVFLAMGQWFSPDGSAADKHAMRINFSRSADARFFTFLKSSLR